MAHSQIQQIRQELQKLPVLNDGISVVNSLNHLGTLYRTRNADSCFYYGMAAKRLATTLRYEPGQTEADHVIAFALFKKGLYAESLELLGKLLRQYHQRDDAEKILRAYLDMAEVGNKGIFERAKIISLLQKAIQTGEKLGKDSLMAEAYLYYCNRNSGLTEDSIRYYLDKSQRIANRYNDESMLIYNQLWQSRLLALQDKDEEALSLAAQSLIDAQRVGNATLEFNALAAIGNHYVNTPRKQLELLYRQYAVARNSGDSYLEIYILNTALAAANALGDKDEIIKAHVQLANALSAEWEKSKKFMGDYVKYNTIEDNNKALSAQYARRGLWLAFIVAASSLTVMAIYATMLRRSRKAKEQVEALNAATNMQIIAMEEAKRQAVKDEQQRLGQDLHDGLSASIAGIKHQLETLGADVEEVSVKHKLAVLLMEVTNAYEATRNKSHAWFSAADAQEEESFEQRVKLLSESALPESRYHKEIHIDEGSLARVDMDTRITLLRVIQEAITNIIKHAKAKKVEILIYEETDTLQLVISDDGKGLGAQKTNNKKPTLGLQSIRRRVQYLNGKTRIETGANGTEITVSIPLTMV